MQPVVLQTEFTDHEPSRIEVLKDIMRRFEDQLNPSCPTSGPMAGNVIACGEVSSVLTLDVLPGWVCKRMSGFETADQVSVYLDLVQQYCRILESLGIAVVPTELVPVRSSIGEFVVYLLQPALRKEELGNTILKNGSDENLFFVVTEFLKSTEKIFSYNNSNNEGLLIAADSQISNWHVTREGIRLLDIGTPCLRKDKKDLFDSRIIGKAMPFPVRFIFNRAGMMQRYFDSYFCPREIIIDHVANYIKEGRPDRIPIVLKFIHRWISKNGNQLKLNKEISMKEIKTFYCKDSILLEAFLQCRRLDRFIKTRVIGSTYNYILPENISRF